MAGYKDIDREALLNAFDRLSIVAAENGTIIDILVYGGSALMFASNFRFSTGDVDIAPLGESKPDWFDTAVAEIAKDDDHFLYGSFPRTGENEGIRVFVPTAEYMLALKLKSMRVFDPSKGEQEKIDIQNLLEVNNVKDIEAAMEILGKYFPVSAKHEDKRFLLKQLFKFERSEGDAPVYPTRSF